MSVRVYCSSTVLALIASRGHIPLSLFCALVRQRGVFINGLVIALLLAAPASAQTITGTARVIDGDTLEVAGQKVRLHGVDAPELQQTCGVGAAGVRHCGMEALLALEKLLDYGRKPVTCRPLDKDRYGRVVARCYVQTYYADNRGVPQGAYVDLGGWLVRNGHAVAFTQYSREYLPQEAVARGAKLGLWSGSFVAPAEWRKGRR